MQTCLYFSLSFLWWINKPIQQIISPTEVKKYKLCLKYYIICIDNTHYYYKFKQSRTQLRTVGESIEPHGCMITYYFSHYCRIHTGANVHENCGKLLSDLIFLLSQLIYLNTGLTGNEKHIYQRLHTS